MKQPIKATIQTDEKIRNKQHVNIGQILKQPISRKPISAQFIQTKRVDPFKTMLIKPCKLVTEFDEKGKENIEKWLAMACIGTTILDTATKALTKLEVIDKRDAVFDLIGAFKQLKKYFNGNELFDEKERKIDDFMYWFLTQGEEHQNRVMKFSESVINKRR